MTDRARAGLLPFANAPRPPAIDGEIQAQLASTLWHGMDLAITTETLFSYPIGQDCRLTPDAEATGWYRVTTLIDDSSTLRSWLAHHVEAGEAEVVAPIALQPE